MKKLTSMQRIWSGTASPVYGSSFGHDLYVGGEGHIGGFRGLETSRAFKCVQSV